MNRGTLEIAMYSSQSGWGMNINWCVWNVHNTGMHSKHSININFDFSWDPLYLFTLLVDSRVSLCTPTGDLLFRAAVSSSICKTGSSGWGCRVEGQPGDQSLISGLYCFLSADNSFKLCIPETGLDLHFPNSDHSNNIFKWQNHYHMPEPQLCTWLLTWYFSLDRL